MTQAFFHGPGQGRTFSVGVDRATAKVEAADTGDAFSLIEYVAAPNVPGPPLHIHRVVSETFVVLDGEVEFRAGNDRRKLTGGSTAFIPPGIPHTFAVAGTEPARWMGIFSPGRYIGLVEGIGNAFPSDGGPPDEAKIGEVFAAYDTEVVPEG